MLGRAILASEEDPYANLALEEAIFLENEGVTIRIWTNEESVIIGRAQVARLETDLDYCASIGIPIVRRLTAGGAVYNGPGNMNWSLFVARGAAAGPLGYERDAARIFRASSAPLLSALAELGTEAWLDPPNRVMTREGKVSGMAAYVSRGGFLCHGTLLHSADLVRVKRLTTPLSCEAERKYARSRDVKTANARVEADCFIRTYLRIMEEEIDLELDEVPPTRSEDARKKELLAKYTDDSWNLGDPFQTEWASATTWTNRK